MTKLKEYKMYINGEWVDAENKKTFKSLNPENDFEVLVNKFAPLADFLTIDISCPNSENGLLFLSPGPLEKLLDLLTNIKKSEKYLFIMIFDVDAMPSEAKPNCKRYGLKLRCEKPFTIFQKEEIALPLLLK